MITSCIRDEDCHVPVYPGVIVVGAIMLYVLGVHPISPGCGKLMCYMHGH